ncbi:MAG: hypothetical protein HZA17_14185 [Nitrospirae bacterium]|nr:hypothetical protein [Nitrospirota bacterium]
MKKVLFLVFAAFILTLSLAQSSEAEYGAVYPNGNELVVMWAFDGIDNLIVNFDYTGGLNIIVQAPDGGPSSYYGTPYFYVATDGSWWYSLDGLNWSAL